MCYASPLPSASLISILRAKVSSAPASGSTSILRATARPSSPMPASLGSKALTAADRVHALLPDDPEFQINRAHALMFVGRGEDSKTLHLAHKGKPLSAQDARLWEHVIAEDFAEFRKAGLTHPMMADIEKQLGVSADHR